MPCGDGDTATICAFIGIVIITLRPKPERGVCYARISPSLPDETRAYLCRDWPEWAPAKRHKLPEYVPDCRAGAPAPIQLTAWKIAAIKIAVILETRPVSRTDFQHVGIDHRRWLPSASGWLRLADGGCGWLAGPNLPDFRQQHPVNFEQIRTDAAKWMPTLPLLSAAEQVPA